MESKPKPREEQGLSSRSESRLPSDGNLDSEIATIITNSNMFELPKSD